MGAHQKDIGKKKEKMRDKNKKQTQINKEKKKKKQNDIGTSLDGQSWENLIIKMNNDSNGLQPFE